MRSACRRRNALTRNSPSTRFAKSAIRPEVFGQPTYNGVAILSLLAATDVLRGLPDDAPEAQKRLIAATINGVRIVNVYIPNGSEVGSEKYRFKLEWLGRLRKFLDQSCDPRQPVVLCGDFNVATEDRDVHDPVLWAGKVLCSQPERDAMQDVREWGLIDVFRQHHDGRRIIFLVGLPRGRLPAQSRIEDRSSVGDPAPGRQVRRRLDR